MKKYILLTILVGFLSSCSDDCKDLPTACEDVVPVEECLAVFSGWFYDAKTKSCEEIGYSGCDQYGFATEVECLACDCN